MGGRYWHISWVQASQGYTVKPVLKKQRNGFEKRQNNDSIVGQFGVLEVLTLGSLVYIWEIRIVFACNRVLCKMNPELLWVWSDSFVSVSQVLE